MIRTKIFVSKDMFLSTGEGDLNTKIQAKNIIEGFEKPFIETSI